MKLNTEQLKEFKVLYEGGISAQVLAKKFCMSRATSQNYVHRLGLVSRASAAKIDVCIAVVLYRFGFGLFRLSKIFDVSYQSMSRSLRKHGVVDSTRQFKKKPGSRRRYRKRSLEFSDETKRRVYECVGGVCQVCRMKVVNWRCGTYHHIVPMSKGGDASVENCLLLHGECHEYNFSELHGGIDFYY